MSFTFSLYYHAFTNLHTWTAEQRSMPRKSARAYDIYKEGKEKKKKVSISAPYCWVYSEVIQMETLTNPRVE